MTLQTGCQQRRRVSCTAISTCACSCVCTDNPSSVQRKLAQVIKKSGMRGQIAIIVCLCVTLVILLVIAVN